MKSATSPQISDLITRAASGERLKYLFFWGHAPSADGSVTKSCFSQWWPSPFEVDGVGYATAEHYMMAGKARMFGDDEMLQKILGAAHPKAAKSFGRKVKNFSDEIWQKNSFDLVVAGNEAKFRQNSELGEFLLNTQERVLVEASPVDDIWGIGLAGDCPEAQDPATWRGLNLLGFALMEVRRLLKAD